MWAFNNLLGENMAKIDFEILSNPSNLKIPNSPVEVDNDSLSGRETLVSDAIAHENNGSVTNIFQVDNDPVYQVSIAYNDLSSHKETTSKVTFNVGQYHAD